MKLNLGCREDRAPGFVNLDMESFYSDFPWRFEDGLPYPDKSVEGILASHVLNALPMYSWEAAFAECFRVLESGGVFRIYDADCMCPTSKYFLHAWDRAVTTTDPMTTIAYLRRAGFSPYLLDANKTYFKDDSLLRRHKEGFSFHVEGVRG